MKKKQYKELRKILLAQLSLTSALIAASAAKLQVEEAKEIGKMTIDALQKYDLLEDE